MSKRTLAIIGATVVSIIYGVTFTIAKDVMPKYVDAYGFILMRVGGSTILFWLIWLFIRSSKKIWEEKIDRADFPRIIWLRIRKLNICISQHYYQTDNCN